MKQCGGDGCGKTYSMQASAERTQALFFDFDCDLHVSPHSESTPPRTHTPRICLPAIASILRTAPGVALVLAVFCAPYPEYDQGGGEALAEAH